MPPLPASGDLNAHPELSGWRSHVSDVGGLSYFIRTPSLKFAGLPVPKIWLILNMALSGLVTLSVDLCPFEL